jgi:hypothetical protein
LIQAISLDGVLAKDLAPVSVQQVLRGAVDDIDPLPVACREFQHRPVAAEMPDPRRSGRSCDQ